MSEVMQKPTWLKDRDVLWLQELADGKSLKELEGSKLSAIGAAQQARNRLYRLRKLFGARTTEQMVAMAIKNGWVTVA